MSDSNEQTQAQKLQEDLPETPAPDPTAPLMPFKTSYVLTREQEDQLVQHCVKRCDQIAKDMGRDDVLEESSAEGSGRTGAGGGKIRKRRGAREKIESWMAKRARYTSRYECDVSDRVETGTIYESSNYTASLSQRIVRQMVARAVNFFFGQPDDIDWFTTEAVGEEDETLSDKIKKHSRFKIKQCGVKKTEANAIEYAFVRGEAVTKCTHQQRFQIYQRTATILVDAQHQPILDAHGDFIVQGDAFVPEMKAVEPDAQPQQQPGVLARAASAVKNFVTGAQPSQDDSETPSQDESGAAGAAAPPTDQGQPQPNGQNQAVAAPAPQIVPTGEQVLKRDGVTKLPEVQIWEEQVITRKLVTFEGPEPALVYYKDFLCPLDAPDIQTADLIAHLYDMDLMRVAQMFAGQFDEGDSGIADFAAAVERLRAMSTDTNQPKAAARRPRREKQEVQTDAAAGMPLSEFAECWLTYSKDGNGMNDEILVILDRRNKAPIYYEYAANVTVRGLRPFRVKRPMAVDGRWYGMGAMEYFESEQEPLDLFVNRHNFATSKSGRVTFWTPENTVEGDSNPNLSLNDGGVYKKKPGKEAKDCLEYVELPNNAEQFEFLLNLFMQLMQTKSGVLNSADQEMSGLPSNQLATGINEIKDSGRELFGLVLMELFPGVESTLMDTIDVIYANMNKPEVFSYFNGDANEILSLTPEEVRDLNLNVTLALTRSEFEKTVQTGPQADALIAQFYQLPFPLQQRLCSYYRQRLRALGITQVDRIIEPFDASAGVSPQQKIAESINYKDAPSSIRRQMEIAAGMKPATEEESKAETEAKKKPEEEPAGGPAPKV